MRDMLRGHLRAIPHHDQVIFKIATGRFSQDPFGEELIAKGRKTVAAAMAILLKVPAEPLLQVPEGQPFFLHLLAALAKAIGDPDDKILSRGRWNFAHGVPVGVGVRLPRTPAVYERKVKWRTLDETEFTANSENYKSAKLVQSELLKQLREEEQLQMCLEVSNEIAFAEYPGDKLRVAALGAIEKGDSTFRILHDGTHGVQVNPQAQPRDQIRMPGPAEARTMLAYAAQQQQVHFAIQADVSKAHRRFKVLKEDWGLQACRLSPHTVWLNKVGTFGIGTAGYWWSRLAAAIARLAWAGAEEPNLWQLLLPMTPYGWQAGQGNTASCFSFSISGLSSGHPLNGPSAAED